MIGQSVILKIKKRGCTGFAFEFSCIKNIELTKN